MDSITANPVSLRSESSRMDLHLPAGSAGPWLHWSSLSLLAPRPHPPSQNHQLAGHASGAGQAGIWQLVRGTGFPRPRLQTKGNNNTKLMVSSWPGETGSSSGLPCQKKVLDYLMGFDKKEETNKGEKYGF